jgi:hypothetical protein
VVLQRLTRPNVRITLMEVQQVATGSCGIDCSEKHPDVVIVDERGHLA